MQVFTATQLNTHLQIDWKAFAQDKKNQELGCTERNKQRNKDTEKEIKPPKK